MSHETRQLVNSFECLLSYAVLDIKDNFCSLFSLKKTLLKYILLRNQLYFNMDNIKYLLLFCLATNNLTYYGRRHLNYSPTVMFRGTPCI